MSYNEKNPDFIELRNNLCENPKSFVSIVGAGLSKTAGLPDWKELKEYLINDQLERISCLPITEQEPLLERVCNISGIEDLWNAFDSLLELMGPSSFESSILSKLTKHDRTSIPSAYELLWKLNLKGIISFNLDTFSIDAHSRLKGFAVDNATNKEVSKYKSFLSQEHDFCFYPHGTIKDVTSWIMTESQKTSLLSNSDYVDFMKLLFNTMHCVIFGFNIDSAAKTLIVLSLIFRRRSQRNALRAGTQARICGLRRSRARFGGRLLPRRSVLRLWRVAVPVLCAPSCSA